MTTISCEPACPAVASILAGLPASEDYGAMPERCYLDDEADADEGMREAEDDFWARAAAWEEARAASRAEWDAFCAAREAARDPDDDGFWGGWRVWDWADGPPEGEWEESDA